VIWNIPADTKPGEYRICHYGDSKDIPGKLHPYQGVSSSFRVGEAMSINEIIFNNSYGKQVEL